MGLGLSVATIVAQELQVTILQGRSLDLGLSLSRATLSVESVPAVQFQGRQLSLGLSLAQATLQSIVPAPVIDQIVQILGRALPVRNIDNSLNQRQSKNNVYTPIPALQIAGAFPVVCPSKRILLGSKIYPFAGLDYIGNFVLSSIVWKYKRDAHNFSVPQIINQGNFTDILAATRFMSQTINEFGTYLYELQITNTFNETTLLNLNILCNVIAGADKNAQRNVAFRPFSDFMIAKNPEPYTTYRV